MFAGSCIGVILLVMALEFFRRLGKEYDRYILRAHLAALPPTSSIPSGSNGTSRTPSNPDDASASKTASVAVGGVGAFGAAGVGAGARDFRPGVAQQAIRALLHVVQFTIAYFVMLLAMYYNGYIIICIFIGAYIGSFVFSWERIRFEGPREEVTVCCG
jgi:copper transporter 1